MVAPGVGPSWLRAPLHMREFAEGSLGFGCLSWYGIYFTTVAHWS